LFQNGPRRQEFASLAPWGALLTAEARSELRTSARKEMEQLDLGQPQSFGARQHNHHIDSQTLFSHWSTLGEHKWVIF